MRAFIFSLDAFVAFTLALFAVYTLIFFSSIPSSYQYVLTQAHYLSKDALYAASTSDCTAQWGVFFGGCSRQGSALDNIVFGDPYFSKAAVINTIGITIPKQFGYTFEVSSDGGNTFDTVYDTSNPDASLDTQQHATDKKKLSVSSQVVVFDYNSTLTKYATSPYRYTSCMGGGGGSATNVLLTCGPEPKSTGYISGGGSNSIVPSTGIRIVRLTIFL